jgi:hypothetical protein
MSEWEDAPVGTVLVQFEDGSAIVKSDGNQADIEEMARFFADVEVGGISDEAQTLIRVLVEHELTVKAYVPKNEPRASARDHVRMVANALQDLGVVD